MYLPLLGKFYFNFFNFASKFLQNNLKFNGWKKRLMFEDLCNDEDAKDFLETQFIIKFNYLKNNLFFYQINNIFHHKLFFFYLYYNIS